MISLRVQKNKKDIYKYGLKTYWLHQLDNDRNMIDVYAIKTNADLDRELVRKIYNRIVAKHGLKDALKVYQSEVETYFKDKGEESYIFNSNEELKSVLYRLEGAKDAKGELFERVNTLVDALESLDTYLNEVKDLETREIVKNLYPFSKNLSEIVFDSINWKTFINRYIFNEIEKKKYKVIVGENTKHPFEVETKAHSEELAIENAIKVLNEKDSNAWASDFSFRVIKEDIREIEQTFNGMCYKNYNESARENNEIIYISEYELSEIEEIEIKDDLTFDMNQVIEENNLRNKDEKIGCTWSDILELCEGNIAHAEYIFDTIDWQSPSSLYYEMEID